MISNITSNHQTESLLTQGDRIYLYGDTNYTGRLIRPIDGLTEMLLRDCLINCHYY